MSILIGENIRRLRKEKKMTQEALSNIFNVSTAAVSKWENNETYPDIGLLFPLAHFFGVTIDELMGYDYLVVNKEIKKANKKINDLWLIDRNWEAAKKLSFESMQKYPNDYEIMIRYLFFITGGQADNDKSVLIEKKDEINEICDKILERCKVENYRLEALTYKAKVLYAEGHEKEAIEVLSNFPSFYHTSNQKIEQLYAKDTLEFYEKLTLNLYELSDFTGNKLGKQLIYNSNLSNQEKLNIIEKLFGIYNQIKDDRNLLALNLLIKTTIAEFYHRMDLISLTNDIAHIKEMYQNLKFNIENYVELDNIFKKYYKNK